VANRCELQVAHDELGRLVASVPSAQDSPWSHRSRIVLDWQDCRGSRSLRGSLEMARARNQPKPNNICCICQNQEHLPSLAFPLVCITRAGLPGCGITASIPAPYGSVCHSRFIKHCFSKTRSILSTNVDFLWLH